MSLFKESTLEQKIRKEKLIEQFENDYSIKLPTLYKGFLIEKEVGQYVEEWDAYLDKFLRPTPISKIKIHTSAEELSYNWLNSVNQLRHDLKFYPESFSLLKENGLLRIADIVDQGGLYLGIHDGNYGGVFKFLLYEDKKPVKVFDSFNEFVDSIKLDRMDESKDDIYLDNGKRYFQKKEPTKPETSKIDSLKVPASSSISTLSSTDFLNLLKEEIENVQG